MRKIRKAKPVFKTVEFHFDMSKKDDALKFKAMECIATALESQQNTEALIRVTGAMMAGQRVQIVEQPAAIDEKDLGEATLAEEGDEPTAPLSVVDNEEESI